MKISAGVIITDGDVILFGHPTHSKYWDLPKGKIEDGENHKDACIRETFEETGVKLNETKLVDLGIHEYIKSKKLHLFLYVVNILPDISKMKCTSYFELNGNNYPEMDKFKYINCNKIKNYITKNMFNTLKKIIPGSSVVER